MDANIRPFYDRIADSLGGGVLSRVGISATLGLGFFLLHYASVGIAIVRDWSWFLAPLIAATMLCVYYATERLRDVIMILVAQSSESEGKSALTTAHRILADRNFVLSGVVFGGLNCAMGFGFGLPYAAYATRITILLGYFVAGFLCGTAVLGIYAVCYLVNTYAPKLQPSLDLTAPDNCGGTLFIGEALIAFSSVTLLIGVLISVYILKTPWSGGDTGEVFILKWFWITLPYILSVIVLLVPAIPLHNELVAYKRGQEAHFKSRLAQIRKSLDDDAGDPSGRKELRDAHDFNQGARRHLHSMRTWPFDVTSGARYLIVLAGNLAMTVNSALSWIKSVGAWWH